MKTLKDFYDAISPNKEVSIYNSKNELVLNRNNICDCDEIVEEYGYTTNYRYEEYDEIVYIILMEV